MNNFEMPNDLIKRADVVTELDQSNNVFEAFFRIMNIPGVRPSNGTWISCSERLPEKYGRYLVTFMPDGGVLWVCVLIAQYSDLMGISKPSFHIGNVGKSDFQNITERVVAWMPLPEAYGGDTK